MKIKAVLILFLFLLTFSSAAQVADSVKLKMVCSSLKEYSSSPNYIVITVKNLKTLEVKEMCTLAPFLKGAYYREKLDFSITENCDNNKDLYFEFAADSALWNITFDRYTKDELIEYSKTVNIPDSVAKFKRGELTHITFPWRGGSRDQKKEYMFAHLMFNKGILPSSSSLAGNMMWFTSEY